MTGPREAQARLWRAALAGAFLMAQFTPVWARVITGILLAASFAAVWIARQRDDEEAGRIMRTVFEARRQSAWDVQ